MIVERGIYPADRKYLGGFWKEPRFIYWVAPAVPLLVQYQIPNKYLDGEDPFQSFEQKGWG
ncbi:MAG: hypothetical protein M0Q91_12300 [Methanoregula sp.]|jgi:hypothetical protein|nr:hypothetical protein [Methanoregula sp.]